MKTQLGKYLAALRLRSEAKTVSEYLKNPRLVESRLSETYYRAVENGDKIPAVKTVEELAKALEVDATIIFRYYLEDILPSSVFKKLVTPITTESLSYTPKRALEHKDQKLANYRELLRRLSGTMLTDDIYLATDDMVRFLDEKFELLPLVHFIYEKESQCSEKELRRVCKKNGIQQEMEMIMRAFRDFGIAKISEIRTGGKKQYKAQRFKRQFRLPSTPEGTSLRRRWMLFEVERGLTKYERAATIETDKTFAYASIDCYKTTEPIKKIQDSVLDTIAALNAASTDVEDPEGLPFFVSIVVSPRPEYASDNMSKGKPRENG